MSIEGKKLAREIIAEEDRQRNVMIRGCVLESLTPDTENVGSPDRPFNPRSEVERIIKNGLKEPSLVDCIQKVVLVGKPYFPPDADELVVPSQHGEDHRLQIVKVTFSTREAARECLRLRFNLTKDFYRYYLSPDKSFSERKKLKELVVEKKKKINEFPEKIWRINKFLKLESFDRAKE